MLGIFQVLLGCLSGPMAVMMVALSLMGSSRVRVGLRQARAQIGASRLPDDHQNWYSCHWMALTFRSLFMREKIIANARSIVILLSSMCGIGALASLFVILVRVPALSTTKLEALMGTLEGAAVALLFAVVALLVNLTYLVHRASVRLAEGDKG